MNNDNPQVAPSTVVFNYCRSLAKQAVRQDFQSEHFIVKVNERYIHC